MLDLAQKVGEFKADLKKENTATIVQKYISHGNSAILNEAKYFSLKHEVANHFKIHHTQVFMVGSGKLGFSIKKSRRFQPFCNASDIDLAIVSPPLFERVWQEVYNYRNQSGWWEKHTDFKKYLFRGWIRPDFLPPSEVFNISEDWWEFFLRITSTGAFGPYKITGGIYASMFFFEGYQSICVEQCKEEEN